MYIDNIKLTNFRSYEQAEASFCLSANVFIGQNGEGKTNLLDAIYVSALGRSYFTGLDHQMINDKATFFRISAQVSDTNSTKELVIKMGKGVSKTISWNSVNAEKLSDHIGRIQVVIVTPQDAFVLLQTSAERRKWIDSSISQFDPSFREALKHYTRLLKQRNEYLKTTSEANLNTDLLGTYWDQMGPHAHVIHAIRKKKVESITPMLQAIYAKISDGKEVVDLKYSSLLDEKDWNSWKGQYLKDEVYMKRTKAGIHKDELELLIDEGSLKYRGSQGQIKSYVMALKLAEYKSYVEGGEKPLLLLDDIFAKLDKGRTQRLFALLKEEIKGQVFITDNDGERMHRTLEDMELTYKIFKIEDRQINEQ